MSNFSFLASLEVAEKFIVGGGWVGSAFGVQPQRESHRVRVRVGF